ncbi:MAG: biotin-dependent carboxyltransferase family protein [Clostridiales bacterium]|nr:biotin-dependent carboxyltransferase family protein [Clostridiales bacterium]
MLGFRILEPGMFSTFQDHGRLGFQNQGMPISGAMDVESLIIANKLVGQEQAALEMTFTGAKIEFLKEMSIAITGADMAPMLNDRAVIMYKTIPVKLGDVLSFKGLKSGFRGYVAFSDKLILEELYNSTSTYTKISTGGYKGRALKKGDEIDVDVISFKEHFQVVKLEHFEPIRVLLGYEANAFKETEVLFNHTYEVTNELDRMGMRLKGEPLIHKESADIISSPIIPGAIQVPKSGQPMIMLRDAQTIGGYTRIGTVISCDLNRLAQMKPGDKIAFESVTLEQAIEAKKQWLEDLKKLNYSDNRRNFRVSVNGCVYDVFVEEI